MRRLWRFLKQFVVCDHPETRRERRNGVLYFVCHHCGYATPAIVRTAAEKRIAKRLEAQIQANKRGTTPVTRFRKRA
jgi:translation initiation factor 2 beta subunit (eIF-2beta)/eIF-5